MRRSPKLALYGALAGVFFLLALVLGRPELAALGAPFALVLIVGLSMPRPGAVEVSLAVGRDRDFEGDEIEAELSVRPIERAGVAARIPVLYLGLALPRGVRVAAGETTLVLALEQGDERRIPLRLVADRWGGYRLGDAVWRASDAAGLVLRDGYARGTSPLHVYPHTDRLRALIAPFEAQPFAGNRVARARGEGIEFAETRPARPN